MNRLNKTESAVFLYCRFSLCLKDPFFPEYPNNVYNFLKILFSQSFLKIRLQICLPGCTHGFSMI